MIKIARYSKSDISYPVKGNPSAGPFEYANQIGDWHKNNINLKSQMAWAKWVLPEPLCKENIRLFILYFIIIQVEFVNKLMLVYLAKKVKYKPKFRLSY